MEKKVDGWSPPGLFIAYSRAVRAISFLNRLEARSLRRTIGEGNTTSYEQAEKQTQNDAHKQKGRFGLGPSKRHFCHLFFRIPKRKREGKSIQKHFIKTIQKSTCKTHLFYLPISLPHTEPSCCCSCSCSCSCSRC